MARLRVWAPDHRRVEVVRDEGRAAMASVGAGWWEADLPDGGGVRYRLSVDGGEPVPDPRSPWQPDGVDGPSATVEHAAFEWTDGAWRGARLASSVLYELHVGTFTAEGTFDAAIGHLDELVDLGVTAVELLPVAEFPGRRGWGYDGVLLWAPHHAYGGPDGLKRFVDAAHARGLAVVLDVVYNHLGPAGNHLAEFGPYFTDRYRTPWGQAINVDGPGSDGVRQFIVGNACMWMSDYHVDGLRLDAVHAIIDNTALHWLEELAAAVADLADRTGRSRWLIAESDRNDPRLVWSPQAGGYGLDATWSDDFHHTLHTLLTGEHDGYYEDYDGTLAQLARTLEDVYLFSHDYSPHRRRHQGRPVGAAPATAFLGYLQNHDQIGNRAVGERSAALMSTGRLKLAAAVVCCAPFVPMLFQGEEWAASTPWQYFTDHTDPELGRAVSEGRTHEFEAFGWDASAVPDPQDEATWRRSVLDRSERGDGVHAELLEWHRRLLELRRSRPELRDGRRERVATRWSEAGRWLVMHRSTLAVALNVGDGAVEVPVAGAGRLLLASAEGVQVGDGVVVLPPESVAVLEAAWPGRAVGAC